MQKYRKKLIIPNILCIFAQTKGIMSERPLKIVYCTPALYMAGGVERVLTLKANYFAEHYGYDITIILTEGSDKPLFYPLSDKIKVVNLDIGFEKLWSCSFVNKVIVYLKKQHRFKKLLKKELFRLRPDITVSLLRREINFINDIKDGSVKVGELHINRANYRNFDKKHSNIVKLLFSKLWMNNLLGKLKKLNRLVVLTEQDKASWIELNNVIVIPNPLPFSSSIVSSQECKRVIAVGRYCHEKGYDNLFRAWAKVQNACPDWQLVVFGDGDRTVYEQMIDALSLDRSRCILKGRTSDIQAEYVNSSLAVCSSRFEGFGLSIVEAMSCGLPVVSFDCPWGPRSIILDKEDGILVDNGNVNLLAEFLIMLMRDDNTRKYMSAMAVKNVRRFNIEHIAQQWKKLFEEL